MRTVIRLQKETATIAIVARVDRVEAVARFEQVARFERVPPV